MGIRNVACPPTETLSIAYTRPWKTVHSPWILFVFQSIFVWLEAAITSGMTDQNPGGIESTKWKLPRVIQIAIGTEEYGRIAFKKSPTPERSWIKPLAGFEERLMSSIASGLASGANNLRCTIPAGFRMKSKSLRLKQDYIADQKVHIMYICNIEWLS